MVDESQSWVGLIAGDGSLPFEVARAGREAGRKVCAIGFHGTTEPGLEVEVDSMTWLHLGEVEALLHAFSQLGIHQAVMVGKVSKQNLLGDFAGLRPDARARELIAEIADWRDDSILNAIARLLSQEHVELLPQLDFCRALTAKPGVLGHARPSDAQWADISFGWPIAKAIGGLDLGQSVVVESQAVLAVEAIEGTDAAVRRGGALGRGSACLVKVGKPEQDPRFDLPTIGSDTLRTMVDSGVTALAFEADCTIILDREELVRLADAHGVTVVAISTDGPQAIARPNPSRS